MHRAGIFVQQVSPSNFPSSHGCRPITRPCQRNTGSNVDRHEETPNLPSKWREWRWLHQERERQLVQLTVIIRIRKSCRLDCRATVSQAGEILVARNVTEPESTTGRDSGHRKLRRIRCRSRLCHLSRILQRVTGLAQVCSAQFGSISPQNRGGSKCVAFDTLRSKSNCGTSACARCASFIVEPIMWTISLLSH